VSPTTGEVVASGEALPLVTCVDAICAGKIIEHVENPIQFLVSCNTALKKGGKFVLSTPNPHHIGTFLSNVLGSVKNLYADTHLYLCSYRIVMKLMNLGGFSVLCCYGDYVKIPGLAVSISTRRFPTLSNSIIYYSEKVENVRLNEIQSKL